MTGKLIFIFISLIFIAMSIKKTKDDVVAAAKKKKTKHHRSKHTGRAGHHPYLSHPTQDAHRGSRGNGKQ